MHPRSPCLRRPLISWLAASMLAAVALPTAGQVNNPAYADYLLVGQFGEICTMCEATVLCQAADAPPTNAAIPEQGSFTLYFLHTRTFWSQVTTIWDWFIANFSSRALASGHSRPMTVYTVENGQWAPPVPAQVHISLEPALLALSDGREIDRIKRRWRQSPADAGPASELGYCQRTPLWDSLAVIQARMNDQDNGGERQ